MTVCTLPVKIFQNNSGNPLPTCFGTKCSGSLTLCFGTVGTFSLAPYLSLVKSQPVKLTCHVFNMAFYVADIMSGY